jgi:hypothetical protein
VSLMIFCAAMEQHETTAALDRHAESVYALFIDIMGFASAVESLDMPDHVALSRLLQYGLPTGDHTDPPFKLAKQYFVFQNALTDSSRDMAGYLSTVAIFSDSSYIVARRIDPIMSISLGTMIRCYRAAIPVRMGIGRGGYARLPFSTAGFPSGMMVTTSPFLGSAIVRAYKAQATSPPFGFRILIHPSAAVRDTSRQKSFVDLPAEEQSPHATQELNFVEQYVQKNRLGPTDWLMDLRLMRKGVTSERALMHYDATERAIKRMP